MWISGFVKITMERLIALNVFFSIEHQAQTRTQRFLYLLTRRTANHAIFDVLWSELGKRFWKGFTEAGSKHAYELDARNVSLVMTRFLHLPNGDLR